MKRSIYIFSNGTLERKQNTLAFEGEKGRKYVPVENTSELYVFGEIDLNKRLLEFLTQKQILLHFFNHYGYYIGSFYPREYYNSGFLTLKQAEYYLDPTKRLDLARRFVAGATENMKRVLGYYARRGLEAELRSPLESIKTLQCSLSCQKSTEELMAIEGNIRTIYYGCFDSILQNERFAFGGRTRRPPQNRLNALISFGNSLMYVIALGEIYRTHLDPRIGFLHTTNFRRFSLNLDVAEVFKPVLVDRLIFSLINRGQVKTGHFTKSAAGIFLTEAGRKFFVEQWEQRLLTTIIHPNLKRKVSYRRLIRLELYKVEKHLAGDKSYEPYVARW